jgi:hypothetical protein
VILSLDVRELFLRLTVASHNWSLKMKFVSYIECIDMNINLHKIVSCMGINLNLPYKFVHYYNFS